MSRVRHVAVCYSCGGGQVGEKHVARAWLDSHLNSGCASDTRFLAFNEDCPTWKRIP